MVPGIRHVENSNITCNDFASLLAQLPDTMHTLTAPAQFFNIPDNRLTAIPANNITRLTINGGTVDSGFAFINSKCKALRHLDLSATGNHSLTEKAFCELEQLKTAVLPNLLLNIANKTFMSCTALESIAIPSSVTAIETSAFENCRSLKEITFKGASAPKSIAAQMLYAAAADTVPQLKTIGDWAFYNCHELASVALPEGVRSVGKAAFYGCTKIAGITLPSSLNTIGNNAFALCESLKRMDINATTPPEIDSETFYKVGRTVPVYVPDGSVADYKAAQYWRELNIQSANAPTDTDNVEATPEFTVDGNSIVFTEETEVAIYTVAGIRVYSGITQSVTLPHSGIYVVVTPNTSTRIAIQR